MKHAAKQTERLRSAHFSILIVQFLIVAWVTVSAWEYKWPEGWIVPYLALGMLVCGGLHLFRMFAPEKRLPVYAAVILAALIVYGVHPVSILDIGIATVLALTVFSQVNNPYLLHLTFAAYLFVLAYQVILLVRGNGVELTGIFITQLITHAFIVIVVYVIAMRIVRRRMADLALDEQEIGELKELKKHTEDFLANVSHELRTPINAVTGIGDVMVREAGSEESMQRAESIVTAGRLLGSRVEDMLDFTEIDTGRLVVTKAPYSLSQLADEITRACGVLAKDDAERITVELAEGIPDRLVGGERWIRKMLQHQIESAIRLAEHGSIYVSLSGENAGDEVRLCTEVRHNGDDDGKDMLSLRILKGLVAVMGGELQMTQNDAGNAVIRAEIPQQIAKGRADGEQAQTENRIMRVKHKALSEQVKPGAQASALPQDLFVLVVDDEPMNLLVAEDVLSGYGMEVETADSGPAAIEKVRETGYDIIFMDHMMPGMDGVEAAHRIQNILAAQERHTKIVALTANAVSGARDMFMKEGFDGFVAKPIVRTELERTLKEIV